MPPLNLFYSYAAADDALAKELEKHLAILKRSGIITGWDFRKITAGTDWASVINEHLETAGIILLLVSADFIDSDYCYDIELKRAMARHEEQTARVIPIIVRAVDWQGAPFACLQALPKDAKAVTSWPNKDEAWADVTKGIRRVAAELDRKLEEAPHAVPATSGPAIQGDHPNRMADVFLPIVNQLWQFCAGSFGDSLVSLFGTAMRAQEQTPQMRQWSYLRHNGRQPESVRSLFSRPHDTPWGWPIWPPRYPRLQPSFP